MEASASTDPLAVVTDSMQEWYPAMGEEPDPPGEGEEFAPITEPSTWCAALLTLAALLWPLTRRSWMQQRAHLEL